MKTIALTLISLFWAAGAAATDVIDLLLDDQDALSFQVMVGLNPLGTSFLPNASTYVITPGVAFSNAFATAPICAPSRATLLTGKYPHNHGVLRIAAPSGSVTALNDSNTLPTKLGSTWFRSLVGKYINGYGRGIACTSSPTPPGCAALSSTYVPPGWDDWHAIVDEQTDAVYNFKLNHNGTVQQYGGQITDYLTGVLADQAASSIATGISSGKPIYLAIHPMAPHIEMASTVPTGITEHGKWWWYGRPDIRDWVLNPTVWSYIVNTLPFYQATGANFNEADVSDKPAALQHPLMDAGDIAGVNFQYKTRDLSLLAVDTLIGRIATALGPTRAAAAIWIITSDHGFRLGQHRGAHKSAAYEESIRVPLYISGPGYTHRTETLPVLLNDLPATIIDIAGLGVDSTIDGRSLKPLLLNTSPSWRNRFMVYHLEEASPASIIDVPSYFAIRTGPSDTYPQRKLVEYTAGPVEYYVLPTDSPENVSRHSDPTVAVERVALSAKLAILKACAGATCIAAEN